MIITCPYCHKQHRLREGSLPTPKSAAHCKGCGRRFVFDGSGSATSEGEPQIGDPGGFTTPLPNPAAEELKPANDSESEPALGAIPETFPDLSELPPESFALASLLKPDRSGKYQNDLNRQKTKLILATAPLLIDRLLAKGEKVHRIASGIAYFRFEIPYANGLLTWPLNYYALVATNRRLLLINLDYHLTRPDRYVFQIPMGEIAEVSRGFYGGSLIVKTKAGQLWNFTTVKRALATELTEFIREFITNTEPPAPEADLYRQLCPVCFQPVPERMPSCPHCHASYKSVAEAIKKSLLLPGLGTLYLAYNFLGISEMLGYLMTWLLTIILVIIGIPGGIFGGGMLVLAYHLMAAYMAGRMTRKGYIAEPQFLDDSGPE